MSTFFWILGSTLLMSVLALVGLLTLLLSERKLKAILLPLVALSAGALLGGSYFHLIPKAVSELGCSQSIFLWFLAGFSIFFLMEQFIEWHHCHRVPSEHKKPVTYLILVSDTIHNFIGGLAIASSFLVNVNAGIITWLAAAAHEIPQELGDFGILLHGGWEKREALFFNFLSALTVVAGGLVTYFLSGAFQTTFLLPFAAGNFTYIAASDLIPEVKHGENLPKSIIHFGSFLAGLGLLFWVKIIFEG